VIEKTTHCTGSDGYPTPSEWEDMGAVSLWLSVTAYPNKKMITLQ